MDYATFQTQLEAALPADDDNGKTLVATQLPQCITYVENRLFRDFELVATRALDASNSTTQGLRNVVIPPRFLVVESVALLIGGPPPGGKRLLLLRTDLDVLDLIWPEEDQTQVPVPFETYFALYDQNVPAGQNPEDEKNPSSVRIAPTPDQQYQVEFRGLALPKPLSAANTTNVFSVLFPDLYFALGMVYMAGALKGNYGAQAEDPQQAVSWEGQYQHLKAGVDLLSLRQRAQSAGWSAYFPARGNEARGGGTPQPQAA